MKEKGLIYQAIQNALPFYYRFKRKNNVPDSHKAILSMLEDKSEISSWLEQLIDIEYMAISLVLDGWQINSMIKLEPFKRQGVSRQDIHNWLHGKYDPDPDKHERGIIPHLVDRFLRSADYCEFCHNKRRRGDNSPHPKLSGTVCRHREMWLVEEQQEYAAQEGAR